MKRHKLFQLMKGSVSSPALLAKERGGSLRFHSTSMYFGCSGFEPNNEPKVLALSTSSMMGIAKSFPMSDGVLVSTVNVYAVYENPPEPEPEE